MLTRLNDALPRPRWLAHSADPVFRVLTSLVFIVGGLGHFGRHEEMLQRIAESPWRDQIGLIGDASALLWISGALFVGFGASLAVGLWARLSALILFVTLILITIAIHVAPGQTGPLFKNVAILGALFFIYVRGAGQVSMDRTMARRKLPPTLR